MYILMKQLKADCELAECLHQKRLIKMTFSLFSQVQLTQDIPEFNLKKGSMGFING